MGTRPWERLYVCEVNSEAEVGFVLGGQEHDGGGLFSWVKGVG